MKPKTKGDSKFNRLREIIRNAQNQTKQLEYSQLPNVGKVASWQWNKLEVIFQLLGPYCE